VALYKSKGIVLRSMRYGEADRILDLYTPERGLVSTIAKGIRRTKSRFGGRLEPLSCVDFLAYGGRTLDTITQAEVLRSFHGVREDLARLEVAGSMVATVRALAGGDEADRRLFNLLYHALASPGVVAAPGGQPLRSFPTRAELEAVENYVFGVRPPTLGELAQRFPGARLALAAFAGEYRPAAETVHRRHADLCFSRTGVARVGTAPARYEPDLRGFWPTVAEDPHGLRVLPAAYSAYLAVQLRGDAALFGPMGFDRLRQVPPEVRTVVGAPNDAPDGALDFWVPVHKLFSGAECLQGLSLTVGFRTQHLNEKIRRVHRFLRAQGHDSGWREPDIDQPPFAFTAGSPSSGRTPRSARGCSSPSRTPPSSSPRSSAGPP
jgi:hypothetical protein